MAKVRVPVRFEFEVIPIEKVPSRTPIVYPPADQRGSEYDRILRSLDNNPGRAVKIIRKNRVPLANLTIKERRGIQSGLITISKNRLEKIGTRVESDAVYAFVEAE
ncbi:MAG: hypothetical protein LAP87_04420 [Acidobacteriia bacterium]|nr:hypothetical protein [Terriglobia bacterium]